MANNYVKIFYDWNKVKIKVHFSRRRKYFKQGRISREEHMAVKDGLKELYIDSVLP